MPEAAAVWQVVQNNAGVYCVTVNRTGQLAVDNRYSFTGQLPSCRLDAPLWKEAAIVHYRLADRHRHLGPATARRWPASFWPTDGVQVIGSPVATRRSAPSYTYGSIDLEDVAVNSATRLKLRSVPGFAILP